MNDKKVMQLKNLLYIGNKLSKHGVTPTTIEILGPLLEKEGFNVWYSSSQKNQVYRMFEMLWSVFRYRKVDYVLIDTYSTKNFWYAFATSQLCRMLRVRYIPILHGGNLPSRLMENPKISKMIFGYSFQNISPSHFLEKKFKEHGFANVSFVPNAIQLEKYPFGQREKAVPNLLWVRSFSKIYNPIMAVEVLARLKKQFPQASLCMVGPDKDGSLSQTIERAQNLGVEVQFTGSLTKSEWIEKSKEYSIFINTTHFDNMPVSVIEAMALGLAIVSTDVGGIPFLVENEKEGLLVQDNDVEAMVEAIMRLVHDKSFYDEIRLNARAKVFDFEWQQIKLKWITILK